MDVMNSRVIETLWQLVHSPDDPEARMNAVADELKTAQEPTCRDVVSLINKIIKAEDERPHAKLIALKVGCI